MAEIYTSNAQGNLNTVLGAIGTAGVLTGGSGILGGLFGNNQNYVTKENLQLTQANAAKDAEIAMLKAEQSTDKKILDTYAFLNSKDTEIRKELREIAVYQAHNDEKIACLSGRVKDLEDMTKLVIPSDNVMT